jgi:hypothetical protein
MNKLILTLNILLLTSCASTYPKLLPNEERAETYEIKTNLPKDKAFDQYMTWAAETFKNSNKTIKMKDKDSGIIIAKGNVPCTALKLGSGFGTNQILSVTIRFEAKNKQATLKITDIIGESYGSYDSGLRPSTPAELKTALNDCVAPLVRSIEQGLKQQ